ncbi:MAG: DUF4275 family protein [Candidatus Methanoplasma sp.]|jgi:hypothetical protein|nr:DUF4275 family protein [Candidatus Methanoplasma sp.]
MGKKITVREFILGLQRSGIETAEMSPREVNEFKNKWYRSFIPLIKDNDRLRAVCLGIDDDRLVPGDCNKDVREYGFKGFLWHAYRNEAITDCKKGGYAKVAFNKEPKRDMILLDNFSHENTAFLIRNIPGIKAEDIDNLTDVTLTDADLKWTYSKTHEDGWFGPYFYKK